jgi:protein-disulfide isomerase
LASIPAPTAPFEQWRHCHEREENPLSIPVGPDDHSRGPLDAKLTVVEYGDYQCPYCGQAFPIVEKLRSTFADSMRFIFRNLPLADVHPHAEAAAEIAEAVGLQGKFWEIHDALFENQRDLSDAALRRYIEGRRCRRYQAMK